MAIAPLQLPSQIEARPLDFTPLSDLAKTIERNRDKAELGDLGQKLASGEIDYKQAAGAAAKAGHLDISLNLLKLGEERASAEKFNSFIASTQGGQAGVPLSGIASTPPAPQTQQPTTAAVAQPNENIVAPPRPEVQPSARVWGDKEAQAAGLYETPTKVAQAPTPQTSPIIAQNPAANRIPALIAAVGNPGLPQGQRDVAKALLEHALKSSDLPPDMKEYATARASGDPQAQVPYTEWHRANKTAGATMINTAEGMDAAQAKARIAIDTHAVQDLSKKVASGRSALPILQQMMAINDKTPGGWTGAAAPYVAKAAASLGIEVPEGASNAELFNAMSRQFIPSIRDPGSTSNYEQSLYLQAVPSLSQSPEGRAKIATLMKAQINRNGEILSTYRKYVGSPELDLKLVELDKKPMFSPDDVQYLKSAQTASAGQGGPVRVNSAAERDALPAGAQYIAPDGTTRTKQ